MADDAVAALRSLRDALRGNTISDAEDLAFRLAGVLDTLGIAPPRTGIQIQVDVQQPASPQAVAKAVSRHLPGVQQALIAAVPTFLPALDSRGRALLGSLFAPPPASGNAANAVALAAYLTLTGALAPAPPLSPGARDFVLTTLADVVTTYGIDRLYSAVWGLGADEAPAALAWEEAVRTAAGVPVKVANAAGRWKEAGWAGDVPAILVPRAYFDLLAQRFESMSYEIALSHSTSAAQRRALHVVIEKLTALGLLDAPPTPSRQPALFPTFLPRALEHLHPPAIAPPYPPTFFPSLFNPLPLSVLGRVAAALFTYLPFRLAPPDLDPTRPEERVRRAAEVLGLFLGEPTGEAWSAVLLPLLKKNAGTDRDQPQAAARRMVVAWTGTGGRSAATSLINRTLDAWSDPTHIRFGTYAQQFNLTHTLLLSISLLPPMDARLVEMSRRPRFIQAIQAFLSHPDAKLRRLGMLVAEVVSERTIAETSDTAPPDDELEELKAKLEVDEETGEPKRAEPKPLRGPRRLQFTGMWDGSGDGRDEARWLRSCVGVKDADAVLSDDASAWMLGWDIPVPEVPEPKPEPQAPRQPRPAQTKKKPQAKKPMIVMLNDDQAADPLSGYTSSPSSSRSPSPTPEFLDEVAADPSLALDATKKRALKRPVYVRQLAELLRDKEKPDSIELALEWGEGLIRAKRNFGTEVSENAVAVAAAAIALANPFNLDDFETRRQGLVTALVACAPREVPPFLAEQYFSSTYGLHQKSVMLTALAMGARELAGLPAPEPRVNRRIDFPTKTLPAALHNKYITADDTFAPQLEDAVAGMRSLLLAKGAERAEAVPEIARERRLRVTSKRRKVGSTAVALDSMDVDDKDAPAPQQDPVVPYTSVAAEYFILPLINHFWNYFQDASVRESRAVTLGARFRGAGTGLVLSPTALDKFLLTLALLAHAARHAPTFLAVLVPSVLELAVTVGARHLALPDTEGADAQVTGSALELSLAVLDASVDLDTGRSLATDAPQLVLAAGEWAGSVFEAENNGLRAGGGGGTREGRIRAAAAAVVVKVSEIGEKWGR